MCVCALCVCVYVCVGAGGAGIGKCVWVWGLRYMHRWCWCGSSCSVLQKWYEIRTKFAQSSYEIRANFVRISSLNTYHECRCYEFRTKFVPSSNNLHEFVLFFFVCVGVSGRRGCCLCGRGCMVCACLGDMCMHWWFLGSLVVLLNHVGQYFCVVCSLLLSVVCVCCC